MSSGLNSLAAVIWEDVLKQMSWAQNISDKQQVMVTRGLAALAGVITVGLAILTSSGIEGVLQLGNTAMSVLAGPLLALFLLGFFTHTANRIVSWLYVRVACNSFFSVDFCKSHKT